MQLYWPTTPNIAGCYMLRPLADPVACCCVLLRVVAQRLKPVKLLATANRHNISQYCLPHTPFSQPFDLGSTRQKSVIPYVSPKAKRIIFW